MRRATDVSIPARKWPPHTNVARGAVRFAASSGQCDVQFTAPTFGFTDSTEPPWDDAIGATTPDGGVTWKAELPQRQVTVGTSVWRPRAQGIVQFGGGVIERVSVVGAANYAVSIWGNSGVVPFTAVNRWIVNTLWAGLCGGGVFVHGNDANAGPATGCFVTQIARGVTPTGLLGVLALCTNRLSATWGSRTKSVCPAQQSKSRGHAGLRRGDIRSINHFHELTSL